MKKISPYRYPALALKRKHGPQGYSKYGHHRPWLRDEFDFRCVYCLKREQWCHHPGEFELDHQVAQSIDSTLCRDYMNLVYACHNCNHRKGNKQLPSPDVVAYGVCMQVLTTGTKTGDIVPLNDDGIRLIDELGLDQDKITGIRRQYILTLRTLQKHDWSIFLMWMGFPDDMPDLATVDPQPRHNTRPDGVARSWFRRSPRPAYYE